MTLPQPRSNRSLKTFLAAVVGLLLAFCLGRWSAVCTVFSISFSQSAKSHNAALATPDTLALYVFANSDPEALGNLQFFVDFAIKQGTDGADYIVLVQSGGYLQTVELPALPPSARYVPHKNECYDWGSLGWLLFESGEVDVARYKFFMFLNSSVRGPFLPGWLPAATPWHRLFTQRLNDEVKVVGPVISCEGTPFEGKKENEWRNNPHVQSYALATDQVGLRLMREEGEVFKCWSERHDAIYFGELGSSRAVLRAGHNLDCFMIRYQGIDWRNTSNWHCNARVNPGKEGLHDGTTMHPLEAMFVKSKAREFRMRGSAATLSLKYQQWFQDAAQHNGNQNISSNSVSVTAKSLQKLLGDYVHARGQKCFDYKLYKQANLKDLALYKKKNLWAHFRRNGQFEGRIHRFTCNDRTLAADAPPIDKARVVAKVVPKLRKHCDPQAIYLLTILHQCTAGEYNYRLCQDYMSGALPKDFRTWEWHEPSKRIDNSTQIPASTIFGGSEAADVGKQQQEAANDTMSAAATVGIGQEQQLLLS